MKKLLLSLAVIIGLSFSAELKAQNLIGVRAGYHQAKMTTDLGDFDALGGVYLGVMKDFDIIPFVKLNVGLEYFTNGFEISDLKISNKLNTLSIPVLAKVKLGPIYAMGGLGANIVLGQTYEVDGEEIDVPAGLEAASFDLPVIAGVGFKILMVGIEARYHYGTIQPFDGANNSYLQLGAILSL